MILLVTLAAATTWVVNKEGTGDFGQVQSAIDVARAGDIIEVGPGTYRGALLVRSRILTLRSRDGAGATILDGAGEAELLRLESADVVLEGFTLLNEGGLGVVTVDRSEVEARDLAFTGLLGAFSMENGSASFEDCHFTGGTAEMGAGIRADAGVVTVSSSSFEGNTANYGADIYLGPGGRLSLEGVSSTGAVATQDGGSVYLSMLGDAVVSECSFDEGSAVNGGAIALADASLTLDRVSFTGGTAASGGAVHGDRAAIASLGARFDGNRAREGGAITLLGGSLDDAASEFIDNDADVLGGAIHGTGSRLDLLGSTFSGNVSKAASAIRLEGGDSARLSGVALVDNDGSLPVWGDATWSVDGLSALGGSGLSLSGSGTLAGLALDGAGLLLSGDFELADSTLAGSDDALLVGSGAVVVRRTVLDASGRALLAAGGTLQTSAVTVLAGDVEGSGGAVRLEHTTVLGGAIRGSVEGHSVIATGLVEDTVSLAYSDLVASPASGEGNISADPQFLDPSADLRLWQTSPCIDAGDPSATDPDGTRADMGAWSGPDLVVTDADYDGHDSASDCDDADGSVFPGAVEFVGDGLDQDCDGEDLVAVGGDSGVREEGTVPPGEDCGCDGAVAVLLLGVVRRKRGR